MFITDIKENEKVTIESYTAEGKVSYNVRVKNVLITGIVCEAITEYKNNGMVIVDITEAHNDIVYTPDKGLPVIWKNVNITMETLMDRTDYVIKTYAEGVRFNRRKNNRVFLGIKSIAAFKECTGTELLYDREATLKDISITGLAFLSKLDMDVNQFSEIMLSFKPDIYKKALLVTGDIERKVKADDGFLYGVRITGTASNAVRKFIERELKK